MAIEVRTRVVAEIYRGVDFPEGWLAHSTDITAAMGKQLLFSVMALLDAESQAVAACWQIPDHEEQFARCRFDDSVDPGVLDCLERDLGMVAQPLGITVELLTTFLWEPRQVPRSQAMPIYKREFSRGKYAVQYEWNTPERDIHASADNLIVMFRSIEDGLAEPLPGSLGDMQDTSDIENAQTFLMLPVKADGVAASLMKTRGGGGPFVTLMFAAGVFLAIALYAAYLSGNL